MRKGDFSLEILVNNEVLPEYEIPLSKKAKLTRSREKQTTTYIAVPSNCHFCIRVGVHSTLGSMVYKGIHYVDGQNDDTYMELNPLNDDPYTYIYGFYNYDKTVFHKFKFDTSCWTDDEIFVSNLPTRCTKSSKKDLGVISVYVFTAERLHGKRLMSQCKKSQEEVMLESPDLLDNIDNIDPRDVIYLDKPQEEPMPNLRATSNKPVAELHIHYQTKEWLRNEGFDLIRSSDNSLVSTPNANLFEDRESNYEIVASEQNEVITGSADDDGKKEFLAKVNEECSPSIISDIYNNDNDGEEDEGKSFKEKDKIENENPNYGIIRENLNEQIANKSLDKEAIERNSLDYEVESRIIEIITERKNIIDGAELADNERRIKGMLINDGEENRTFKDEGGKELMVNEFKKKLVIDLTVESPREIIEISDGDDDVILVETVKSFLPTTVNKKKQRNKKIKYYSDSSIDWNNDDSSNYSDSSSEDEFISISKKRLRT